MNRRATSKPAAKTTYRGPRPLARIARGLISPALRRQGFAHQEIVTRWREIAGPDIAAHSLPDRLRFPRSARSGGTLFLRVEGPFALEVQHRSPMIIARLNSYFGYAAVEKLVLIQGPLPQQRARTPRKRPEPLSAVQEAELGRIVAPTQATDLKAALHRLGAMVLADKKQKGTD